MTTPNDDDLRALLTRQLLILTGQEFETHRLDQFCQAFIDHVAAREKAAAREGGLLERDRCTSIVTDAHIRITNRTVRKVLDRVRASIMGGIAEYMV